MARVPLIEREEAAPELRPVYDRSAQRTGGRVTDFFKVLTNSPGLPPGYEALAGALRHAKLDRRLYELAYLKASQVNGCHY